MSLNDLMQINLSIKMVTDQMIKNLFCSQLNQQYLEYIKSTKTQRQKLHTSRNANQKKTTNIYSDGSRQIIFDNGVKKQTMNNGYSIVFFANGDIKQIYRFDNGQVQFHYPDGKVQIRHDDDLQFKKRMQSEQTSPITQTHNLFLHKLVANKPAKSIHLMNLQTHTSLFINGIQYKYITNVVIAGRNFIQLFAVFNDQITIQMGSWPIQQDILNVCQWQKNIIITTQRQVVGLVYQDCFLRNSFMLSLECLQLGFRQKIQTYCDKLGYYMVISTNKQILICISQKSIIKYKSRPFQNSKIKILEDDVKWNRPEHHAQIADVIRIDLIQFDLAKIQYFHFSDQLLYFLAFSNKTIIDNNSNKPNSQKSLYQIQLMRLFRDDQRDFNILKIVKIQPHLSQCYVLKKDGQTQFIYFDINGMIYLQNQKGTTQIQNQSCNVQQLKCRKSNNSMIFPLYTINQQNYITVYQRISNTFNKRKIKLNKQIQIQLFDIQQNLLAYCNNYQCGIIFLKNKYSSQNKSQNQKQKIYKPIILKQYIGRIIDFNISQTSILLIQNTFKKKTKLRLLRKSITQNARPIIMRPKKILLQSIPDVKQIRSLFQNYQQQQIILSDYLLIKTKKSNNFQLYKISDSTKQLIQSQIQYYKIIKTPKNLPMTDNISLSEDKLYLLLIVKEQLLYYQLSQNQQLKLKNKINLQDNKINGQLNSKNNIHQIYQYLISPVINQNDISITIFKYLQNIRLSVQICKLQQIKPYSNNKLKNPIILINQKVLNVKKKDKDLRILQITIIGSSTMRIFQLPLSNLQLQLKPRLIQTTHSIGEGLPLLLPSSTSPQQLRSITCPQYLLMDKDLGHFQVTINDAQIYHYNNQTYLIIINCKDQILLYKKHYLSASPSHPQGGAMFYRQQIGLNFIRKFKSTGNQCLQTLGTNILKVGNLIFYKGQILQLVDGVRSCFYMQKGKQIWAIFNDNKIKLLITDGKPLSHYLSTIIPSKIKSQMLSIQSTNDSYVIYNKNSIQIFDRQLNPLHYIKLAQQQQSIITMCGYQSFIAVSFYNYCYQQNFNDSQKKKYKSVKFKIRIYNTITGNRLLQKQSPFDQPILHIRYIQPDKLVLTTNTNISINILKPPSGLQNFRNKHYSKRSMVSSFSLIPQKIVEKISQPSYMLVSNIYGGLSFMAGYWIQRDKMDQIWFQNLRCGINHIQLFKYGAPKNPQLKALIVDDSQNIIVLQLLKNQSKKICDYQLGSVVTMVRKKYQIPYISCEDGNLIMVSPIKLKDQGVSFLQFQQQIMKSIPFLGGFNNRDSRVLDQRQKTYKLTSTGNMVDSQIIKMFLSLTDTLKNNIYNSYDIKFEDLLQLLPIN